MDLSAQSHPDERIRERDNVKGKLSNRDITFTAPLLIGSEEDKVRVMVNTGLNLFWVPTRNCDYYSNNRRDTIPEIRQCEQPEYTSLQHWLCSIIQVKNLYGIMGKMQIQLRKDSVDTSVLTKSNMEITQEI